MVEEVKEDVKHPHPASSETHFASPAHPTPGPATTSVSTCLTNGSDHPSPPVCHQARKWTFNSAVLGAKFADPAFQSVSTEIHIPSSVSSPKIHSSPQSRNTLRPAGCFTLKSYNSITILFNLSPKKEDEEEETDHWGPESSAGSRPWPESSPFCHWWSFGSLPLSPLACLVGDTSFPATLLMWLHRHYLTELSRTMTSLNLIMKCL